MVVAALAKPRLRVEIGLGSTYIILAILAGQDTDGK
jgi:hypothetical protein